MNASNSRVVPLGQPYSMVVGIDFDPPSDHALWEAFRIARTRPDAALHVVHVVTDAPAHAREAEALNKIAARLEQTPKRLRSYVIQKAAECTEVAWQPVRVHTRLGVPAKAILQLAVDLDAELIIVGTHGRRGIRKLALGSVAAQLVEMASCPVLIARPKNFEGLARSPTVEPVCPECAQTRVATSGEQIWCEYHRRPQIRPHTYSYSETFRVGGHHPGIVPSID